MKPRIFGSSNMPPDEGLLTETTAMQEPKRLVLFDFDGTLTWSNSLLEYLLFAAQWGRQRGREGHRLRAWRRFLAAVPALAVRLLGLLLTGRWSNGRAKENVIAYFFTGKTAEEMRALGERFCREVLPSRMRPQAMTLLRAYRDAGAAIAVVSASLDLWLSPFCKAEKVAMICTEAAFENGRFTGRFATPNCNYAEKGRRVKAAFDLQQFDQVVAYGNSRGDAALFELADEAWFCRRGGHFEKIKG